MMLILPGGGEAGVGVVTVGVFVDNDGDSVTLVMMRDVGDKVRNWSRSELCQCRIGC